ncbi:MAG: hypothetical protein LBV23_02280 [Deltaproteobacteria bacterium]|jgi:hypothetical protein|nr:hypothetical protein [Deltaproteobacteria bacterium]
MIPFNNRLKAIIAIDLVWTIVSVLSFIIIINRPTQVQLVSLLFWLFSFFLVSIVASALEVTLNSNIALRAYTYGGLLIYLVVSLTTAFFYLFGFDEGLGSLLFFQAVWFGALTVYEVIIYVFFKNKNLLDKEANQNMLAVIALKRQAETLSRRPGLDSSLRHLLTNIEEEIKYFDRNSSSPIDEVIGFKLTELDRLLSSPSGQTPSDRSEDPFGLAEELLVIAKNRKMDVLEAKRGGF